MPKNFYLSGTLRDNILWKIDASDQWRNWRLWWEGLGCGDKVWKQQNKHVAHEEARLNQNFAAEVQDHYLKNISFYREKNYCEDSEQTYPWLHHIKLSNRIEASIDVSRIVEIRNNNIWQDESVKSLRKNNKVGLGLKLREINYEG